MMFTIDLRKGAGLPPKSRPIIVILAMVPFLIPLLGTLVMAVSWEHNQTLIRTQREVVHENQQKIKGLENGLEQYRQVDKQIRLSEQQLQDAGMLLSRRIQLTPVLAKLVELFPESLLITTLGMDRNEQRKNETDPKTGNSKQISVVQRRLHITIGGPATAETDNAVGQYVRKLLESPVLMKWFENIRIAARNNDVLDGQNYAFYEIECVMKDQI
jgi:hypothetical protein